LLEFDDAEAVGGLPAFEETYAFDLPVPDPGVVLPAVEAAELFECVGDVADNE